MADAAFLAAIRAHPEDDGPRLVYADWLDEHGDAARAELIRVQCDLAHLAGVDPRSRELRERERDLLQIHEAEWVGELPQVASDYEFHRGFVDRVLLVTDTFLTRPDTIARWAPVLSSVKFHGPVGKLGVLLRTPALAGLTTLDLRNSDLGPADARDLADWPGLSGLRQLLLADNFLGDEIARSLTDSPYLGRLRLLDLIGCRLGPEGVRRLVEDRRLASLYWVGLQDNPLGDAGVRELARAPFLANLGSLDLSGCDIGPAGAAALAGSPHVGKLQSLRMSYNPLGDAGVTSLARCDRFTKLLELSLNNTFVGDTGARELLHAPFFDRLTSLAIGHNRLTRIVQRYLTRRLGQRIDLHD